MNNWNDEVRTILASICDIPGCNADDLCEYDVKALDQIRQATKKYVIGEDMAEDSENGTGDLWKGMNILRANQREAIK